LGASRRGGKEREKGVWGGGKKKKKKKTEPRDPQDNPTPHRTYST
jgi:hypothetical protein